MKGLLIPLALMAGLSVGSLHGQPVSVTQVTEGWLNVGGRWDVDKKGVVSGLGFLKYNGDQPLNFRFRGELKIDEFRKGAEGGSRFEICFRRNPAEEWPTYLLRIRADAIALVRWDQGKKTLDEIKVDVPTGKWIKLELQMSGGKIQARIGKKIRLKAVDPTPIEHKIFLLCAMGMKVQLKDLDLAARK